MPKRPTIVSLAAAVLIISATFSNRVSASTRSPATASFQSISVNEEESQYRSGKRKKEFQGVAGIVSSINGGSITLTGKDNITYVVDASSAQVKKKGLIESASLADIKSGDKLLVKGVVTGSAVAATEISEGRGRRS